MANSEKNNSNSTSGGITFVGLLTIVFIVLKLCKVITWPWLWVLSPVWGTFVLALIIVLIIIVVTLIKKR